MPKVSVVIAVYNAEDFIEKAVSSIQSQTFLDWELIICDDCSTDGTRKLLAELSEIDDRIRVLYNSENLRSAATRNKCIEIAQGKYIAIQDADDYSHELRLEKQVGFLDSNPQISIVGSYAYLINDSDVCWGTRTAKKYPQKEDFLWGIPFFHPSVMMRRADLIKARIYRESKETRRMEDYDMFVRMYAAGFKGYNIQEPLYYYREDVSTYKKRKYKYRIDEAVVKYNSFKALGLLFRGIPYVLKPLIVGLIPTRLMMNYRVRKDKKQ